MLGTDATEDGRGQSRALVAAVCVAAVLAAAVVALLQRDTATAAPPVEVAGSMFFDDITSRALVLPYADRQDRDAVATGSIELELPDRQLRGDARLEFGASREQVDGADVVVHAWGHVRLRFGSVFCRGWFGWSNFVDPLEGGGSLHARCEDGGTLTARLVATPQPQAVGVAVDLEDGWWTTGG
ncbi:MAG: hypothetical protein M3P31_07220 [Actinomycetota bacterium]|nr:hypothetical protein [Actinomycetota bacterium]